MPDVDAVTIGNFDGVHRGHQALLVTARARVGERGRVVAMVFDPHPQSVLHPATAPLTLTTYPQRCRQLQQFGADEVIRLAPDADLLSLSPEEFIVQKVLPLRPAFVVEGEDFRFGRNRAGSIDTLIRIGKTSGFETIVVSAVEATLSDHAIVRVSSTMLRWLIRRGRVRDAHALLGEPFAIESSVTMGEKRGRLIGCPTANLAPAGCLLPADGVYAGWAERANGSHYPAAISVGANPTFDDPERRCEAHLIGFGGALDEYGWKIRVTFQYWLRDQIRYNDAAPLVAQIARDITRAQEFLASTATPHHAE